MNYKAGTIILTTLQIRNKGMEIFKKFAYNLWFICNFDPGCLGLQYPCLITQSASHWSRNTYNKNSTLCSMLNAELLRFSSSIET